jgi:MscS family membrane protein
MGQRRYRRLKCNVSLTYDTPPDKIEAFCEGVREIIRLHPYMRKDYFHVYLNALGASSLDVLVYVFWETPDWSTELRERQRFLLDILRLAKTQQIDMAFPTQTLHLLTPSDTQNPIFDARSESNSPSVDSLSEQSRNAAKNIVSKSTGLDSKPPPVKF